MSLGAILYRILIGPLELFFEIVFVIADRHVDNPAYAIIFLSLAMNFLVLPLYRRADAVQAEERDRENALAPWIKHIKKTFKGDERFMMLQAYYRENNYKPTDSLKGSISLLLEIPFFIAAYHFLSNLETLRGVGFGPIRDLGAPDALLTIGGVTLNLLPILMTLINVISAAIYMKGFPLKSKIQMYGIAAIFLVFLYNSPAGLVFYWTLNNLFSLIKNIFYKLPDPAKVLKILASVAGAVLLVLVIFVHPMPSMRSQIIVVAGLLCLQIPLLKGDRKINIKLVDEKDAASVFYFSAAFMAILTGLLIPSSVIGDSAEEFIDITGFYSPYWYIVSAFAIALGTFMVWFTIFYRLASKEGKQIFSLLMAVISIGAAADYMLFGKGYGNLSSTLIYDVTPVIGGKAILINAAALAAVAVAAGIIFFRKIPVLRALSAAMCIALVVMSGMNIMSISRTLTAAQPVIEASKADKPEIRLSRTAKNVVVIMMDRQAGHYIPFIMHEKPELKEKFSGFTYYSNSFSYGNCTNVGSPGLYGGYDYIPAAMNRRSDMKLVDKHNEALKVMPKMFSDAGYDVTVFDPTYAGYTIIPDLSIYNDMPEVHKSITMGRFPLKELSFESSVENAKQLRMRNFFMYSVFKVSPCVLQPTVYSHGTYNAQEKSRKPRQEVISETKAEGMNDVFLESYAVLCHLPDITKVSRSDKGSFLMMSNDTTHSPMLLQEPAFAPAEKVDNSGIESYMSRKDDEGNELKLDYSMDTLIHYQTNVAAMIKLGEWLDYLKENGVYDNTRIIIVSDHGKNIDYAVHDNIMPVVHFEDEGGEDRPVNTDFFNNVLLVKDFNAKGFETNSDLISNADTPYLATEGLIKNPENPFTGSSLGTFRDQTGEPELIYTDDWQTDTNNGNTFLPADWYTIRSSIFEKENWGYLGKH